MEMIEYTDKQRKFAEKISKIAKIDMSEATVNAFANMAEEKYNKSREKKKCFKDRFKRKFKRKEYIESK